MLIKQGRDGSLIALTVPDAQDEYLNRVEAKIESLKKKLAAHPAAPTPSLMQPLPHGASAQQHSPVQMTGYAAAAHPSTLPQQQQQQQL